MKALLAALLLAFSLGAHADERRFSAPDLEALLAPIALYPDTLVAHVLAAATYPDDVPEAAAWLEAHPHLKGEEAVRAADPLHWHPSLKALLAYPELLQRMAESPQWTEDLGSAYLAQQVQVMATVHALRQRAHAHQPGAPVIVQPTIESSVVYLPYYNPHLVYGPWRHARRPIHWRAWHSRPHAGVTFSFSSKPQPFADRPNVHRPHVHRPHVHRPHFQRPPVHIHNHYHQAKRARPIVQGAKLMPDRRHGERGKRPGFRQEHRR